MLDMYARRLNPFLSTIEKTFHQGYHWCIEQCEYATDIMFESREDLEDIYPSLVGHAFYRFKCEYVFSFMGRKLCPQFLGEVVSDYRKRPEGWRIKHRMKSNSIKMYDKCSVLRIEMTINDPREFKVYKKVHHKDGSRLVFRDLVHDIKLDKITPFYIFLVLYVFTSSSKTSACEVNSCDDEATYSDTAAFLDTRLLNSSTDLSIVASSSA